MKIIGTYDNNNYFTRAVEFNAGSEGTGFTYKVYQRNDIDWNMVRTTGAKKGRGLFQKVDSIEYWKARGRDAMKEMHMKYNCKIINIVEDEVTIRIGDAYITGFVNCGITKEIGQEAIVELLLYDDLEIIQCDKKKINIERRNHTFAYSLFGILDIASGILKSVINFEIAKEELYNYGYLDGKQVQVDVLRIDLDFE